MIFALPGMGADKRVFPGAWQQLADVKFVEWTPYAAVRSIPGLAAAIADREGIKDGDSIIGTSLGGMVACEISTIRKVDRLVLVASAVNRDEISGLLAALRPLAPFAPVRFVRTISSSVPGDLARMLEGADDGFVRAMCGAMFEWEGLALVHSTSSGPRARRGARCVREHPDATRRRPRSRPTTAPDLRKWDRYLRVRNSMQAWV